jgi:hypothetical protein
MSETKLFFPYQGKQWSVPDLFALDECVVSMSCLRERLKNGMDVQEAMTKDPKQGQGGKTRHLIPDAATVEFNQMLNMMPVMRR